jgi:hypothetical protein
MMAAEKKTAGHCRAPRARGGASSKPKASISNATHAGVGEEPVGKQKFRLVKASKAREREVEKAKSMIYGALPEIIAGVLKEAIGGNHNAARFLMQYAGIKEFALPALAAAQLKAAKQEVAPAEEVEKSPEEAVAWFYKELGVTPPVLLPPGEKRARVELDEPWMAGFDGDASPPGCGGIGAMNGT